MERGGAPEGVQGDKTESEPAIFQRLAQEIRWLQEHFGATGERQVWDKARRQGTQERAAKIFDECEDFLDSPSTLKIPINWETIEKIRILDSGEALHSISHFSIADEDWHKTYDIPGIGETKKILEKGEKIYQEQIQRAQEGLEKISNALGKL